MIYVALGCIALALIVKLRPPGRLAAVRWRYLAAAFAVLAFTGAAYAGVRGAWGAAAILIALGCWMAVSTRRRPTPQPAVAAAMSELQARAILGVGEDAGDAEVQAAYRRMIARVHPDTGGTSGLAAQLTAARDRLLGR